LDEWTDGLRNLRPSELRGLWWVKKIGKGTSIYCRAVTNAEAMTVDYHCAWDQGEKLGHMARS